MKREYLKQCQVIQLLSIQWDIKKNQQIDIGYSFLGFILFCLIESFREQKGSGRNLCQRAYSYWNLYWLDILEPSIYYHWTLDTSDIIKMKGERDNEKCLYSNTQKFNIIF